MEGSSEPSSRLPSVGATAVLLHLTYLRAQAALGAALARAFPTRDAWLAAQQDPALLESVESLGQVIEEVRAIAATVNATTLDELATFGSQHYDRALEAVEALAERVGVDPADLLTVCVYA